MTPTIAQVKQALDLTRFDVQAAHARMAPISRIASRPPEMPGTSRLGGVLLLLFPKANSLHLLLTRRRDDLPAHPGQISFPGGGNEAPESLLETALRETEEEVGIKTHGLEILGSLQPIYIPPSDYLVHPFVAWHSGASPLLFRAAPAEVAEIIEAPLSTLLDPESRQEEQWPLQDRLIMVPYFAVRKHKVWGATAIMLSEFIERLRVISD